MDINEAWKETCRVVLGGEVGELERFEDYLKQYVERPHERISVISKKKVNVASPHYGPHARFISNEEMAQFNASLKNVRLGINEVKDIDSILSALQEQIAYSGSIVIGNSHEVSGSDSISNSQYVLNSVRVFDSKYIAYCSDVRYGDHLFGCDKAPLPKYMIASTVTYLSMRGFEDIRVVLSSDCHYCANLDDCQNCLFSFNQKSRRYVIGNREFAPAEYAKLKTKLMEDIRSKLEQHKTAPTLVDLIRDGYGKGD